VCIVHLLIAIAHFYSGQIREEIIDGISRDDSHDLSCMKDR